MASQTTKIIKPLNPIDFDTSSVKFSDIKTTKDGSKYIYTNYSDTNNTTKQSLVVIKGCKILSFIEGKNLFVQLLDDSAINMIKEYQQFIITKCLEDSVNWFGEEYNEEEATNALKSIILTNPTLILNRITKNNR